MKLNKIKKKLGINCLLNFEIILLNLFIKI